LIERVQGLPRHKFSKPVISHRAEIPEGISFKGMHYSRACFGLTTETGMGGPLEFVYAKDLSTLRATLLSTGQLEKTSLRNRAALAYVSELAADTKIGIYWS